MRRTLLTTAFVVLGATAAESQTWRTMEIARQLRDSTPMHVNVEYGAGRFDLRPTSDRVLYSIQLRYDEDHARPVHRYDPQDRSLNIGMGEASALQWNAGDDENQGEMRLVLPRGVDLDLRLSLGATNARMDLGGLSLRTMHVQSGASSAEVEFSAPNPVTMRRMDLEVGAAGITIRKLGNANAQMVRVSGGVGGVDLEFGGRWTQDMNVEAEVVLGKVRLRVPRDVGIRMEVGRVLASFDHQGLVKRGDAWFSENWDRASHRLRVRARATFGSIEVERTP